MPSSLGKQPHKLTDGVETNRSRVLRLPLFILVPRVVLSTGAQVRPVCCSPCSVQRYSYSAYRHAEHENENWGFKVRPRWTQPACWRPMRLRRPMTGSPYGFDIDHPGTASGYPVWALNHAGTALSADWPTGRGRDSGDSRGTFARLPTMTDCKGILK